MADKYTQFSFAVPELTAPEHAWFQQLMALDAQDEEQLLQIKRLLGEGRALDHYLEDTDWPDFCHTLTEDELLVYTEDSGNPVTVRSGTSCPS